MAEPASAIIQLVHYTYRMATLHWSQRYVRRHKLTRVDTARYVQEFARGVRDHKNRIHELAEKIERHGDTLRTVHSVYERIKDRPDDDIRAAAKNLRQRVRNSKHKLEKLTDIRGSWGDGDVSTFKKVLHFWSYDQDGGRKEVEGILNMLADLEASIRTELSAATIFLVTTTDGDTRTENLSLFSRTDTLAGSEIGLEDQPYLSMALIAAINSRIPKEVKMRLKGGDSILACDRNDCNALHFAVAAGGRRVLAELLKSKELRRKPCGVNNSDKNGETPLHLSVRLGKTELVADLLAANANVNVPDRWGRPPLEIALSGNKDDIAELLLNCGADESLLRHERNKMDPLVSRRLVQIKQLLHARL